ncbi:MAG: agmatine deiminase [Clostridiales bacterium]|nr:agmatine deiminase [Clostridiales bacterium]
MPRRIEKSTPKADGYWMPAEFEPQKRIYMMWPVRQDNWRDGAKPAQRAFANVATVVSRFAEVVMLLASPEQYVNCRESLPPEIRVVEMTANDAWVRDCGPTFLVNGQGGLRACDWTFNAWGGLYDGLYFPWDQDDLAARKISELEGADSYRTEGFVLEGGSFHVDGEGTVLTTEMCLLSPGRNPQMAREEIEQMLCEYLNCEKVLWLTEGIDPDETNGHVDDVACFIRPGEVACVYAEDPDCPFYETSRRCYEELSRMTDAKGRRLKVHRVTATKQPVYLEEGFSVDRLPGTKPREAGNLCIASYLNFLIVNGGVIVPQYGDENDALALRQIQELFPEREAVGVYTREIVYGGGNIHCITQQVPGRPVY